MRICLLGHGVFPALETYCPECSNRLDKAMDRSAAEAKFARLFPPAATPRLRFPWGGDVEVIDVLNLGVLDDFSPVAAEIRKYFEIDGAPQANHVVSGRHAIVEVVDGALTVRDCESLNFTFVNRVKIGKHPQKLADGDELALSLKFPITVCLK